MRARHMLLIKPVEPKILVLQGQKVMLDFELAEFASPSPRASVP
jgi:hypothetical protein